MNNINNTNDDEGLRRMSKMVNSLLARSDCGPFREPVDWRGLELFDYPKIIKKVDNNETKRNENNVHFFALKSLAIIIYIHAAYHSVVHSMMDLGTVKRKLERGQYKSAAECAEDIRLIWTNCKTYNADGSDFYLLAEAFSKRFEDRYKKIRAEFDTGHHVDTLTTNNRPSSLSSPNLMKSGEKTTSQQQQQQTLDVKTAFGSNIFSLSGMELGHVLQVLDLKCPQALEAPLVFPEDGNNDNLATQVEINVDAIDARTFAELDRYMRERVSTTNRFGSNLVLEGKTVAVVGGEDDEEFVLGKTTPSTTLTSIKKRKR